MNRAKSINKGKTDFNRELAERTATKSGSVLLGIYHHNDDGSRTEIIEGRITRDSDLWIRCTCGEEDFINFRLAYGQGAVGAGNGLCLCTACRKGHKSDALRSSRRGEPPPKVVESMSVRSARIERDGQTCTDCKEHKQASDFFADVNAVEKCRVYKGRCYECSRKLRTSNREDALRTGTLEDFMKGELDSAKDRNSKYNRKHPDDVREFTITVPYLVELFEKQDNKCALSGLPMATMTHRDECPDDERCNPSKLSIDRIDSSSGYTEDNVQLVCWWANSMKMDMSHSVFIDRIRTLYIHSLTLQPPLP